MARGKAYGDGAHRPGWPLRGVRGRIRLPVIVFVGSASGWMRPYGAKNKS